MERKEKLDNLVPILKRINPFLEDSDWYKVAGWILKNYGYEQAIKNLPEIDVCKLNIKAVDQNVFRYLTYHLNKLGWEKKADYEKRRAEEDMKVLSEIFIKKEVKSIDPLWLQEARENYRRKRYQLDNCTDPIQKRRLQIELHRMVETVHARKNNLRRN